MFKYVLKRIILAFAVFLIIVSMCFILVKLLPNQMPPAPPGTDPNIWQQRYEALGYGKPIIEQYRLFLQKSLFGGNWGYSTLKGIDAWGYFTGQLPYTMIVNVYTMLIAVPIGLAIGIYAALKKNKWQDHLISTGVMVFISVPGFVTASLVLYFLCFKLNLFPKTMMAGRDYFSWDMFKSMIPAILSMSFGSIAGYARFTRAELTEVLTSEFMLLARTKGLTKAQATTRHALRNAMVPIFPSIVGEFISVLSGSLIIEQIYSIPGVGRLYLNAINAPDYDFFMMLSGFYLLIGLAAGLVIDLSYGIIDPRIRMGAR